MTCELLLLRSGDEPLAVTALVDTGSAVTILSRAVVDRAGASLRCRTRTPRTEQRFVSASGDALVPTMVATIDTAITEARCLSPEQESRSTPLLSALFYVVDGLQPECILGMDFLAKFSGTVDCAVPSLGFCADGWQWSVDLAQGADWLLDAAAAVRRRLDLARMGDLRALQGDEEALGDGNSAMSEAEQAEVAVQSVPLVDGDSVPVLQDEVAGRLKVIRAALPTTLSATTRQAFSDLLETLVAPAARPLAVTRDPQAMPLPARRRSADRSGPDMPTKDITHPAMQ